MPPRGSTTPVSFGIAVLLAFIFFVFSFVRESFLDTTQPKTVTREALVQRRSAVRSPASPSSSTSSTQQQGLTGRTLLDDNGAATPSCSAERLTEAQASLLRRFPCCGKNASQSDLKHVLVRFALGLPMVFAHFNDGELLAATKTDGYTDRGMQANSARLQRAMVTAIQSDLAGAYFGAPCRSYFATARSAFDRIRQERPKKSRRVGGSVEGAHITVATLLIDGNYALAREALLRVLAAREAPVRLVVAANADVSNFTRATGIRPAAVHRVPATNAFPSAYDELVGLASDIAPGEAVLIAAGPLGRLLAVEWYRARPCAQFLELGSFFDLELHGKSFGADYYYPETFTPPDCEFKGDRVATGGVDIALLQAVATGVGH